MSQVEPVPVMKPAIAEGPGVVHSGWLAADSVFGQRDERKLGRAMGASLLSHAVLAAAIILAVMFAPEAAYEPLPTPDYDIVYVHAEGPGGGGGGSPAPAPPREKALEIPKPKVDPPPVVPPPEVKLEPPVDVPRLMAPVYTNSATVLTSSGENSISLAPYGGGGTGTGIGPGDGPGLGPGQGGGFGGGAYRLGSGVTDPVILRQEPPKYTSDAMRAKIQGIVELEAVVLSNGAIGDVRIVKSLDARYGLDQEAIRAAKRWLFRPSTLQGKPVDVLVTLILEFRLH
jgi:TonB family protein